MSGQRVCVVTDSLASIPSDLLAANGVDVVSLFVHDGDEERPEVEIDVPAFYERLADMTTLPTSSQPSVASLLDAFRRVVDAGCGAVGVFASSKMSGTFATALMAADMVREQTPGACIEVVDSGSNSMEEGFGVIAAAQAARAGEAIGECVAAAGRALRRTRYLFTPHSLEYLRRGGRIGEASALIGGLLQIRPILTVEDGEVRTFAKVRTQSRALVEMTRKFAEDVAESGLAQVVVHYIADRETAEQYAREQIEPIAGSPVRVISVSPVVGLHVGPAVGVVYETARDWS